MQKSLVNSQPGVRLNRFLAAAGVASRRGAEELIRAGRVTVNGAVCTNLATHVSETDSVKVDKHLVRPQQRFYVLLNKPPGYICSSSDTHERQTIFELLPRKWPRLFHVGRLDKESEGLLILTNDGDLALRLTHPRYKIEKEYEVQLDRPLAVKDRGKLLHGVRIEGGHARAERVHHVTSLKYKLVLRQGIKRQIRLMFRELGYEVKKLRRVRIGPLHLAKLRPGEWRQLTQGEVQLLLRKPP